MYKQNGVFTKKDLDLYLKELAKEFRKLNGVAMPAELVLVGGAAVLANYGFRDMTADIDAVIRASSAMKDAISRISDRFDLPSGWLNSDFTKTSSYSPRLEEVSVYYRTFSNILTVRTVSAEYLVAMKLRSGRKYKNDISDVVGILAEHKKAGNPLTFEKINNAVETLYGGWTGFPSDSKSFLEQALKTPHIEKVFDSVRKEELSAKSELVVFEKENPGVADEKNINEILEMLKRKKKTDL